ncbi:MAG: hypothetical protein QGE94_03095 [Desulfobacterales bacterium]|nr:hypothetical protein [Desulfobacterales bacterium]
MKKHVRGFITTVLFLFIAGTAAFFLTGPSTANAFGYGASGGQDHVPQRKSSTGYLAEKSAISPDQAREIVRNHINRLNPDLEVGNINDASIFYETEILSKDKEKIQLLGADKFSGRLMLLN